jgi:hypothetical protein
MAGIDLALHMPRDVPDSLDVGDGSAAEFHDQTGHRLLLVRQKRRSATFAPAEKARIDTARGQPPQRRKWPRLLEFFHA